MPCYKDQHQTATVYGLTDPRNGELRYVGCTIQKLKHRLSGHIAPLFYGEISEEKYRWLIDLANLKMKPEIFEIETVSFANRDSEEAFWIGYFHALGCNLINVKHVPGKRFRHSKEERLKRMENHCISS